MSYKIRRSSERKYFDHGWLQTYHTFSFASYYDPNFVGFRSLRVINEDAVQSNRGFPLHDHQDMEILSIVLEGDLGHKDSMGTESVIHANQIQAMSAGTGVTHSEYNPSTTTPVHFLQIWILPDTKGITPRYQTTTLPTTHNTWSLIASTNGREGSLKVQQDVEVYYALVDKDRKLEKKLGTARYGWLQIINGEIQLDNDILKRGDGVAFEPNSDIKLQARTPSTVLFFDLR